MESIRDLMKKSASQLSGFEKKVVLMQEKAIEAKERLEEMVGTISMGVVMGSKAYPSLTQEQKDIELESYGCSMVALKSALRYLTDNCKTPLEIWQFFDLLAFVKENYPQAAYGNEDPNKGSFYFYHEFQKVLNSLNAPLSDSVNKIIQDGLSGIYKIR